MITIYEVPKIWFPVPLDKGNEGSGSEIEVAESMGQRSDLSFKFFCTGEI